MNSIPGKMLTPAAKVNPPKRKSKIATGTAMVIPNKAAMIPIIAPKMPTTIPTTAPISPIAIGKKKMATNMISTTVNALLISIYTVTRPNRLQYEYDICGA